MPELPEVEIMRRGLAPAMEGASFAAITLNRADLRFAFEPDFAARLQNERVIRLSRRAKYIVAETGSGLALAMHLGMTGRFTIQRSAAGGGETPGAFYYDYDADPRHDHVIFVMSSGAIIRYNDVRRFGYMTLLAPGFMLEHPHFKDLGVEPLSEALSAAYLQQRAEGKAQQLKAFLLDQRVIAGLGNIYVCEALFRAGLPPEAKAGALAAGKRGTAAAKRLSASIKAVLADALLAGGSSIRDYRHADGAGGSFQEKFDVYGLAGQPCHNSCGSSIERKVQQGRSTFFCPRCQSKI
jgi:formamidopyrimidine-DNA glycosylase